MCPPPEAIALTPISNEVTKFHYTSPKEIFWSLLLFVAITGMLAWFTHRTVMSIVTQASSQGNFVETTGEVYSSHVVEKKVADRQYPVKQYCPEVCYTYKVPIDGSEEEFRSDRITFGDNAFLHQKDAEVVCKKYPPKRLVPVWYNPTNPGEAVIEVGSTGFAWFLLICLQPVWVVCLETNIWYGKRLFSEWKIREFFATDLQEAKQVTIPRWGTLRREDGNYVLRQRFAWGRYCVALFSAYATPFLLAFAVIGILRLSTSSENTCTGSTFLQVLLWGAFPAILGGALLLFWKRRQRKTPQSIIFTPEQVQVDGEVFPREGISDVYLEEWEIGIKLKDGEKKALLMLPDDRKCASRGENRPNLFILARTANNLRRCF